MMEEIVVKKRVGNWRIDRNWMPWWGADTS